MNGVLQLVSEQVGPSGQVESLVESCVSLLLSCVVLIVLTVVGYGCDFWNELGRV